MQERPREVPHVLWQDDAFGVRPELVSPQMLFDVPPALAALLDKNRQDIDRAKRLQALLALLFHDLDTPIRYHADMNLTPSETLQQRLGNCLSLAIFTAVAARYWQLPAQVQSVAIAPRWMRNGDLVTLSKHVNVRVKTQDLGDNNVIGENGYRVVDFQQGYERYRFRAQPISDRQAAALFYHNQSVNWLVEGHYSEAYWAAKTSLMTHPESETFNLLGVIYRRAGLPKAAEAVYQYVLAFDETDASVWQNLSVLLNAQGRPLEAANAKVKAARLMPDNPFDFIDQAELLLADGHVAKAKTLYEKALEIDDINEEALWGMAKCYYLSGQAQLALRFVDKALLLASTPQVHERILQWKAAHL
ncbi:tetratricopeptide repeat protein [Gallaecimonas pentaromativorans]|uniref:Tetratricopeptide repeat protein n=1 Tax=Gallaecimonas pentaromativorans TaxID=584787 RepID=A0A3N1PZ77_9GAMM|nr:tetratricopeptide repeat protein [Gallaecimonas pentaromativorans]